MKEYIIGLDIGTTSVKSCVFHIQGKLLSATEEMITSHYPEQGWVEQDPAVIERLAVRAMHASIIEAGIQGDQLLAIGFSCAMHSIIAVARDGLPISPAIIWADGRSREQAANVSGSSDGKAIYTRTGTPIHPMSPFIKLLWMKESGYPPFLQAAYFMSIKEYIIHCWFGTRLIDPAMASATGLFNLTTFSWDPELLERVGIQEEQLSSVVPPTTVLTGMAGDIAGEIGISADLPFVIGAADGQLANLGSGAILPGEAAISVGTSGAIRQFTHRFQVSERQETFCYAFTSETAIIGGPTNNGGIALQWVKQLFQDEGSFEQFLSLAEDVAPGADGLLFLPYLQGERAPIWNQNARGNFYGMTVTHKKEHFIRAVLEGVSLNLYQIGKALEQIAGAPEKIYVNGGLARSKTWLSMMADIFNAEIYVSESHHSAAWGAAWTALVGIGHAPSLEAIKQNIPMNEPVLPTPARVERYREIYAAYVKLGDAVKMMYM